MKRKLGAILIAVCILCGIASAADKPSTASVDPAYQQSFEKWKGELVDDLKEEWLPLAGLFWLKPGENSFGTDPKNAIVFPKGPAHAGLFTLQGRAQTPPSPANPPPRPSFIPIRRVIRRSSNWGSCGCT